MAKHSSNLPRRLPITGGNQDDPVWLIFIKLFLQCCGMVVLICVLIALLWLISVPTSA